MQDLTGTAGNDTFIAGVTGGGAGGATLTAGDKINGGAGTDTIELYGTANAGAFAGAAITSVEVVKAQVDTVGATALNVSANADVKEAWLINGTKGANTVTLTKAQTAGLQGTVGTTATFTFSNATAAAGDAATLVVNGATATAGVSIANIEALTINATGTNSLGTVSDADLETLTVTGAGALTATFNSAALKTINASAATGKQTIDAVASAGVDQTITTGSADDVLTTTFTGLTKNDKIDLGAGTDSLRFTDTATINDATSKAKLTQVAGVEQLGTVSAVLTVDGDFVSQTSYYTDGTAGKMVLTNIANNADVNFGKGAELASTVGMKLGANTLNVNLAGSATGAADLSAGLTVTGSATVNVKSTGTDGQPNNVLALTAADNQSVVVTGSQNLTLTTTAAPGTTGFKIDGSAFTGKLTATGTAAADIIIGGSGNDVIQAAAASTVGQADTLTGGAGVDTFKIVAAGTGATNTTLAADFATLLTSSAGTTGVLKITDFVAGTDKIHLEINAATGATTVAGTSMVLANAQTIATAADLAAVYAGITGIAASVAGGAVSGAVVTVTAGGAAGTYLYVNDATAGVSNTADMLINITGVSGTITANDFIFA